MLRELSSKVLAISCKGPCGADLLSDTSWGEFQARGSSAVLEVAGSEIQGRLPLLVLSPWVIRFLRVQEAMAHQSAWSAR